MRLGHGLLDHERTWTTMMDMEMAESRSLTMDEGTSTMLGESTAEPTDSASDWNS